MKNKIILQYVDAIYNSYKHHSDFNSLIPESKRIVETLLSDNSVLIRTFAIPTISLEKKLDIIEAICSKFAYSSLIQNILKLLSKNKRLEWFKEIFIAFEEKYNKEKGITNAEIITSKELSEAEALEIQDFFSDKFKRKFVFEMRSDSSLLGGAIFKFENKIIDASILGALKRIELKSKELIATL